MDRDGAVRRSSDDAGRGADHQAHRARERAARLRQDLARAEQREKTWAAGAAGERRVAAVLREHCWPALHDQPWPGRPKANIDHLAVSSSRIHLIDAKHWSGTVTVSKGVLRQNGYSRSRATQWARQAAADVTAALGSPTDGTVHPVVCLTSSGAQCRPQHVDGVTVVGVDHLAEALGPAPQDYEAVSHQVTRVREALARPTMPRAPEAGAVSSPGRVRPARSTPRPARTTKPGRRGGRRSSPSVGRFLVALVLLAVLWWWATHLDVVSGFVEALISSSMS